MSLSRAFLPIVSGLIVLMAANPAGIPKPYIFAMAAVLVSFTSYAKSAVNGVFISMLFSFAFYSFNDAAWKEMLINMAAMLAGEMP